MLKNKTIIYTSLFQKNVKNRDFKSFLSLSLDNRKTDFDQSGNFSFDDVTGMNRTHSGRRAGEDEVALLQGEVLRDVAAKKTIVRIN